MYRKTELTSLASNILRAVKLFFIVLAVLVLWPVDTLSAHLANCNSNPNTFSGVLEYDLNPGNPATSDSYCELCGIGFVELVVTNPSHEDMTNFTVRHNFLSTDLEYVPNTTTANGVPVGNPTISGTQLSWTASQIPALSLIPRRPFSHFTISRVRIRFQVRSRSGTEENLVNVNRTIRATADYTYCPTDTNISASAVDQEVLPIREPIPRVFKRGRNVDADQDFYNDDGSVYGNINDDVIWRIQVRNDGLADLQDLRFDDLMQNDNFQINYACPSNGTANTIAVNNGVRPGGSPCVNAGNNINNFAVDDPFGDPGNDEPGSFVDAEAGDSAFVYLVGKITTSCETNRTNRVSDVQWGCEVDSPDGGISQTSFGASAGTSTRTLSSLVRPNGLQIQRELTGLDTSQPVGSRGLMTITIRNNSGGSIKNIHLRNVLPAEYVIDPTFTPTVDVTTPFGEYDGVINGITWTNPVPGTFPLTSSNPADPLANTAPEFDLTSTTVNAFHPDQRNMLRHDDVATVRFRVVMIPPAFYDTNADIDVRVENEGDTTDPDNDRSLSNQLTFTYEDFCDVGVVKSRPTFNDTFPSNPEDLDVDVNGSELIFILTNDPGQALPLQVQLRNRGGHFAEDYHAYVSFGATMQVSSAPASCRVSANPPLFEVWDDPVDIPPTATVYECSSREFSSGGASDSGLGQIQPGQTVPLNFEVIKTTDPARIALDDLSFRADVVGEITLSDGTPLWFPTPSTAPIVNRANNYSFDSLRARVLGFNLIKTQVGTCSENNPPPSSPDDQVQIGEECEVFIETGGWFGFLTPGFNYIAVQRIQVDDELPDGQGYVSSTDPAIASDPTILNSRILPLPGPSVLDEGTFGWDFNRSVPAERILVRDQWFRVNATTRILNDPIDSSAPPNEHAALSRNVLNSTFEAVFADELGIEETFSLGRNTVGYPNEPIRRVDLRVTEPDISVEKQVCNETLYGVGTGCTNFLDLTDDGDTQDSYIYRITLTNENTSAGFVRAPAYDIISTDILDASDLMLVVPFETDGLDNDADGLIDAADTDGEGSISDNIIDNGTPATITFSHTHSTGLLRIDPNASVTFYYRVDPDDAIAPLQQLINTVTVAYDSLAGASGNQTVLLGANSEIGGARVYNSTPTTATVQILPIQTQPKQIIALSNTPISATQPQTVSVGEEIQYQLTSFLPVSNLRDFTVRDELPAGISCSEAPVINLDAPPYDVAGFMPGGSFTPTCTDDLVLWSFGDQEITAAVSNNLFEFQIDFIARIDNSAGVNDADIISNGVPNTTVIVSYRNELNTLITQNFANVDVLIREPQIVLTKDFESASNDALDVITVTVTATNTGTADAYNLRVFDDLAAVSSLNFLNNVGGSDPPDVVDITSLGANRPVFSWNESNPDFTIAPGETRSFTFDIEVDIAAQPFELLDNTIQASWTSLPNQNTALNSTGSIGADGSVTGMRNGSIPNSGDAVNDYETTASASSTVPAASMTKTDLNPALLTEVGAHKNFEIAITLPEGTTNNLMVTDALNAAGLSYVLSNNAAFDITYTFENISSINAAAPAEAAFIAFPADDTSDNAIWNIGTVVTSGEDDTVPGSAITPVIRINYFARLNNDLDTDSGDALQNGATTTYNNGETAALESLNDNTAAINVTESILGVSKTATLITPAPVTGGDVIEYVVTVPNTGNAAAYDVNLVDSLPVNLQLDTTFTPTASIGGAAVTGFVATPAAAPVGPLVWGRANGDDSLDIPVGETLILTYRTVVQAGAQSSTDLINSVLVDWTSLDGASVYERTGAGCPTITAPNDYCVGPATSSITVDDNNTFGKSVIDDSFAPANDATVRIGDTVTYQLSLNLAGTTNTVSVQDVLPTGLAFEDIVSINGDTTADYTPPAAGTGSNYSYSAITAANLPTAGQTGTLTFTIGDVVNDPFGDPTTDSLLIIYRARVIEDTLVQTPTTNLTNTATMAYVDGGGVPVVDPARLESSATITVLQPVMTVPTKTDRSGRTSTANVMLASDVMNFSLSSCNTTGLAPAYSLQVTDLLATQLNEGTITGPVNGAGQPDVYINGALLTAAVDYTYTAPAVRGGNMLFEFIAPVEPGQCMQIDYDIGFYTDFGPNQFWDNTVIVDEYWSLPLESGQRYAALGPTTFTMNNTVPFIPPEKTMLSPVSDEATIGEEVLYQLTFPASNAARFDVEIMDTLHPSLEYISATETSGNGFILVDNTVAPGEVSFAIDMIPAGQDVIIELLTRVANNSAANAGVNFDNTTTYSYANSAGGARVDGGTATTPDTLTIVEPDLSINKTVANISNPGNPPTGGDILRYNLIFTALGGAVGDNFSDVFDVSIIDDLGLGLAYQAASSSVDGVGNTISDPGIAGDGVTVAQNLRWNLADATADIDIVEGSVVTVSYDVQVLDSVLANQILSNTAVAQWTGLDALDSNERNGTAVPVENDYFTAPVSTSLTTPDNTTLNKVRLGDTFNNTDANVRIGDLIEFELRVGLQEGQYSNVVLNDTLPQGLAFEAIRNINGVVAAPFSAVLPFVHNDITPTVSGDPVTGSSVVSIAMGDITNQGDNNPGNDEFVIIYIARVVNEVHPQVNNITLSNNVQLSYDTGSGTVNLAASDSINVLQPLLSVSKSAAPADGDTALVANELVTYTVDVSNSGTAPAYDLVLDDIIPDGMRQGAASITMLSTSLLGAGSSLPNLAPTYTASSGLAVWDFDTGVANEYTIPAGETLRIVYQVQADTNIGAGLSLSNQAVARLYYSFDDDAEPSLDSVLGVREIYGPSNTAITTLTTPTPSALLKENPADTTVSVGEVFSYQITVPETPLPVALHDVRILDDLGASAADLGFVSVDRVSGSEPWTPLNTGTTTDLIIEDTSIGIDIPAGEQVVISISVQVLDTATNVSGLTFNNTASYTYNQLANDPATQQIGGTSTTPDMLIVGADDLTLEKSGPIEMRPTVPEVFTLNIHNIATAPAWDLTVSDLLANLAPADGGTCDNAPSNVSAQIFLADAVTPVSGVLVEGVDYVVNFTGEPSCTFTITMQSAAAALPEDNRLIITYQTEVDLDTPGNSSLTNVAGVTEWFSADTDGTGAGPEVRTYTRTITDGTVGTLDHEDAHTATSRIPNLLVQKSVVNVTTGQDPGSNASPGDVLRYSILVQNVSDVDVPVFSFIDDLDALNTLPMFEAGSLNLLTVPLGADATNTDANGGVNGTGLLDIRNMTLGIAGSVNETELIEFEVRLVAAISSGTVVLNQGRVQVINTNFPTDDPNINGADDPLVLGDEDPTETLIASVPQFELLKTSTDLTDDPNILLPGDTLRYTISARNIGNEDSLNTLLRDQLPANTTYVAGSATLNGVSLTETVAGVLPLQDGVLINAPENTTAGFMRADATTNTSNVATIIFDVLINDNVVNGTIISNQGFVTADGEGSGPITEQPSDDPDTTAVNDPTIDVVGDQPLVDALKTVSIQVDNGTPGILDPGDILRYTITISNLGATPATDVIFTDATPVNTTYVAESVTLNGLPVAQPDMGVSPLSTGIAVSSSDLTPPLPAAGSGTISPDGEAVITFDVQVDLGVATGTVISNQGSVDTNELPTELTDADGIDSNGDQPTLIVVGDAQLLTITKDVAVVGGGAALAGGELEYRVRVTNISSVPASNVVILDNLDLPVAGQLSYVPGSGLLNGLATGVSFSAPVLTADYSAVYGDLEPNQTAELRFLASIDSSLAIGTTVTNVADVNWNVPTETASASISIDVGGVPGVANVNGTLWHDANFDNVLDTDERVLEGWTVEIYRGGQLLGSVNSDVNGVYQINGLVPNDVGTDLYELRFSAPGATSTSALLGLADSAFTDVLQGITDITLSSGSNTLNLNLPIDPNGVVYNSLLRTPVAGSTLTLQNASSGVALPDTCFDDPTQQAQVTLADGYYKFNLNFSQPSCASGQDYLIQITPPATGFNAAPSIAIPPQNNTTTTALDVPNCPGSIADALTVPAGYCEAQTSEFAPALSVAPGSAETNYYLRLTLANTEIPQDSQLFNNHLPIDPDLGNAVTITKTTPLVNVSRSQLVPYTITVNNTLPITLSSTNIIDNYPAGFKYVEGSARFSDGTTEVPLEPSVDGLQLLWSNVDLPVDQPQTIKLLLIVGAAVSEGEYINRAQIIDTLTNANASGIASATVRVVPDPDFDCSDVIGKVFDDKNHNAYQDDNETGLAGVRVTTARGLLAKTDQYGRFHVTCAVVPNELRGSNFIMKLDERSLPSGYRLTTKNPLVKRATRGKMLKFNFGANLHRVVSMDIADGVFETDGVAILSQWQPRMDLLIEQLKQSPSVLRLSYLADAENPGLAEARLDKVKREIMQKWSLVNEYELHIETEIFWRRGAPPDRGGIE